MQRDRALQLLFIELRVDLARSAIQSALLLNGGGALALLLFLANLATGDATVQIDIWRLKLSLLTFAVGLSLGAMTFVNAYVAQGAIASGKSSAGGNLLRRLGLAMIVGSLALFLSGVATAIGAIG